MVSPRVRFREQGEPVLVESLSRGVVLVNADGLTVGSRSAFRRVREALPG